MDSIWSSACDLVTGSGLAALSSADSGVAYVAGGAALGAVAVYFELLRRPLPFVPALFRLVLSATQFLALWDAKDSDVGAGLMLIPLFVTASCSQHGSASEFLRDARLLSSALNAATLAAAAAYYGIDSESPGALSSYQRDLGDLVSVADAAIADASQNGLESAVRGAVSAYGQYVRRLLAVTDAAYAVSSSDRLASAVFRGAVFAVLAIFPSLPRDLLRGPRPDWLLMLYSVSLVQSVQVHACALRLELSAVADPQRALMLLVACGLAVAFVERAGDPANFSFAALAVLSAGLLSWAVQAKWVQRSD